MSLSQEINNLDSELLTEALEFVAHVMNNADSVISACEYAGVSRPKGYAYAKIFVELGLTGSTNIHTRSELEELAKSIEVEMRNPNKIIAGKVDL